MEATPEKGRKNTAVKQLPLWLHPAVSTIRSYPNNGTTIKRESPWLYYVPLLSFQAIVIITGVQSFQILIIIVHTNTEEFNSVGFLFSILT